MNNNWGFKMYYSPLISSDFKLGSIMSEENLVKFKDAMCCCEFLVHIY